MKILAITDGSESYQSGVWTTIHQIKKEVEKRGHSFFIFDADKGNMIKLPNLLYTHIPLPSKKRFRDYFNQISPDAVHIFTEATIGYSARAVCLKQNCPFTTSYKTNFDLAVPSYMRKWLWKYLLWFHSPSKKIHVSTPTIKEMLRSKGVTQEIIDYSLGVDLEKFHFVKNADSLKEFPRPFFMTMSRISYEKNVEAFLKLDLPGTKFVIGEGPLKKKLMQEWSGKAIFLPYENLAETLSQGDVFVCPSKFETFGIVMIEAMACGLPVAAYPVMGPKDIVVQGVTGYMDEDLQKAALDCLQLKKEDCIEDAKRYSWEEHATTFLANLVQC